MRHPKAPGLPAAPPTEAGSGERGAREGSQTVSVWCDEAAWNSGASPRGFMAFPGAPPGRRPRVRGCAAGGGCV